MVEEVRSLGSMSWSAPNPLYLWEAILSMHTSVAVKKSNCKSEGVIINV